MPETDLNPMDDSKPSVKSPTQVNGTATTARGGRDLPADYRGATSAGMDYRSYRGADYRGMDYRTGEQPSEGSVDLLAALWRYRWLVLLPLLIGGAAGYAFYKSQPVVYRSSTKLLIESDVPTILDSATGDVLSGLPGSDLLRSQLKSDAVLRQAAQYPALVQAVDARSGSAAAIASPSPDAAEADSASPDGSAADEIAAADPQQARRIAGELAGSLDFQPESGGSGANAMTFLLHVDHTDPRFAEAGVEALTLALEEYYADKSESTISELKSLISQAKDKLLPELETLEEEYEAFRASQPDLAWDTEGNLINRFRTTESSLAEKRTVLQTERADLQVKMAAILRTATDHREDPILAMKIAGQLMGTELEAHVEDPTVVVSNAGSAKDSARNDMRMERLAIERELIPLEVKRENYASTYGSAHPSVRALEKQISGTRAKLQALIAQENARRAEILSEMPDDDPLQKAAREQRLAERKDAAKLTLNTLVTGMRTRLTVLESQIEQLNGEIDAAAAAAGDLAAAERRDDVFKRRIERSHNLLSQVEEQMARINVTDSGTNLRLEALTGRTSANRIAPVLTKSLAMGTFLGGLLGFGLVYVLESFSKTFRSGDEITQSLEIPVLGQIPVYSNKAPKEAKKADYPYRDIAFSVPVVHRPRSMAAEAMRRIRTSIFFEAASSGAKVFQVTSPVPEDGKSTISANLAASIAHSGKTVVLVDADLRRPQSTATFALQGKLGITELLNGECDPPEIITQTAVENLSVIPSGTVPGNPAEALALPEFGELIQWLRDRYDFVIVDTPPLLVVADPMIVSNVVDGVVFTFRIRRGCRPQAKEAVAMLRSNQAPVLGCVVNQVDERNNSKYKATSAGSYYYRKYEKDSEGKRVRQPKGQKVYEVRSTGKKRDWMNGTEAAANEDSAEIVAPISER